MLLSQGIPCNLQNLPGLPPFAAVLLPLQLGKKLAPSDEKNEGLPRIIDAGPDQPIQSVALPHHSPAQHLLSSETILLISSQLFN